jgi:ADP-ribosylglycohydrolase
MSLASQLPADYAERVYAGVLGKMIGVYLGRPFEGWSYERIMAELGPVYYYVHERLGVPLVVTDDDLSGTFTFLRALPDHGNTLDLTPAQIGETWLNYVIEGRTTLWWGGLGNSTEHTAYLRLKQGVPAPRSGSIELNTRTVAEQIGAQIFIEGWAMVAPGDPERAADLARRAASISHDGEAVYAAQVVAAMEAQAFVEPDLQRLLDTATSLIPHHSTIYRLISDIREWHAREPDWRKTRQAIAERYGYDKFGGNCHVVPNHALVVLGLLYGNDDFQHSLMIVNSCGWDTDCNSGNVGALLGIKNGLAGIDTGPDWRGPVADRLYVSSADGGRAVTDAVTETYHVVNTGRAFAGLDPVAPKGGARFHWDLPGSVQGFEAEQSFDSSGTLVIENVAGHSRLGNRCLALRYRHLVPGRFARAATAVFIPPGAAEMPTYNLVASPTLYAGQTISAGVSAAGTNAAPVQGRLYVRAYDQDDKLRRIYGPRTVLEPGRREELSWQLDAIVRGPEGTPLIGAPVAEVGIELSSHSGHERNEGSGSGTVFLDYLTWDGAPSLKLAQPGGAGSMWRRAWVDGVDRLETGASVPYRLIQDHGTGLIIQGTRRWTNYRFSAAITPQLVKASGIGVRVQGMRRYYALLLCADGRLRLVKALDGVTELANVDYEWEPGSTYRLSLQVVDRALQAWVNDRLLSIAELDGDLPGGGIALICEEGCMDAGEVAVEPVGAPC